MIKNSLAPSTRAKYNSHFKAYASFCELVKLPVMPISQQTLILFATFLCPSHSHKDICAHIAAVKFTAEALGYDPEPSKHKRLYRVIRGIKRTQGKKFNRPPRIPITPALLTALGHTLWNSSVNFNDKVMLWAAMLTAFHAFLRVSEYTSKKVREYDPETTLCFHDITVNSNLSISIHIKASKTDPFRQGTTLHLFRNNSPLCPVQALLDYLASRPPARGPLFLWQDGRYLTRSTFATVLKKIKPPHITSMSSHSFRIGAATTAAAAGFPKWLIQSLGRWSSDCFRKYIRIPLQTLHAVSQKLCIQTSVPPTPFDPDNI